MRRLRRIVTVAAAEFEAAVRSKAFIIGLVLLPVLMVIGVGIQKLADRQTGAATRRFAVVDHTGALYPGLARRAELWNQAMAMHLAGASGPSFEPIAVPPPRGGADADFRLALSERVRRGELFAFVEIPADAVDAGLLATRLAYYSDHPTVDDLPRWLEIAANDELRLVRLRRAGLADELAERLDRRLPLEERGLFARATDGTPAPAAKVDKVRTQVVPILFVFLLFMVVMTGAPQLLNSVLEEKMSRISEVLLGAVSPFELMMGKLIGCAGVAFLLAALYLGGGYATAVHTGVAASVPLGLLAWFLVFLVLAIFLFGACFIAIGAACSDLKDTQNLMMPVMIVVLVPVFTWQAVLRAPTSGFAVGMSLVPTATPFLMLLRIGLHPGPPGWQIALGFVLSTATMLGAVWAAGKIFRTGLLMQGKSVTLVEVARWVLRR